MPCHKSSSSSSSDFTSDDVKFLNLFNQFNSNGLLSNLTYDSTTRNFTILVDEWRLEQTGLIIPVGYQITIVGGIIFPLQPVNQLNPPPSTYSLDQQNIFSYINYLTNAEQQESYIANGLGKPYVFKMTASDYDNAWQIDPPNETPTSPGTGLSGYQKYVNIQFRISNITGN